MGKAKPSQVIVHRLDLQPSLKQSLDDAIMLNAATKTMTAAATAVSGIAAGVGTLLAAGFGAYVTAWGAGQVKEKVLDPAVESIRSDIASEQVHAHGSVSAFVTSLNWSMPWSDVRTQWNQFLSSDLGQELAATPPTAPDVNIMGRCFAFLSHFWLGRGPDQVAYIQGINQFAGGGPKTPPEAWAEWYPVEEAINDGVYETTGGNPYIYTATQAAKYTPIGIGIRTQANVVERGLKWIFGR